MHESRPGSKASYRLAALLLDGLIERRTRMAQMFERLHEPSDVPLGDLDGIKRLAAPGFLIITADDFGLDESVNEAVELGCAAGVLTAASLMVGAPAAADAVRRARRLPRLRTGLHLVLADGAAILPHDMLPGITDSGGRLADDMFRESVRCFALPRIRRQFEAEIRAQFRAFAATGLTLDHVNVHKHFHLHPTMLAMILRVGREFGVSAIRVPDEPLWCAAASGSRGSWASAILLKPWVWSMKRRVRATGLFHNDTVFGLADTGRLNETTLLAMLGRLPPGISEIYLHPTLKRDLPGASSVGEHRHSEELAALLSPRVRSVIRSLDIDTGGFADAAIKNHRYRDP